MKDTPNLLGWVLASVFPAAFHILTLVLIYRSDGLLWSIVGFFMPLISEAFVFITRWRGLGFANWYTWAAFSVVALWIIGLLVCITKGDD